VLAHLQEEPGRERIEAALDEHSCWITTVNTCEVLGKLRESRRPIGEAQAVMDSLQLHVADFDAELARLAADLRLVTRPIGASLGDRACLALAQRTVQSGLVPTVYTAEHAWTKLKWPFKVVAIRPARARA
jgi:ribonuclease VapC